MGKKRAKEHYDFIRKQYHKEIDNSIANTTIHLNLRFRNTKVIIV